jgi:hypothetical protein
MARWPAYRVRSEVAKKFDNLPVLLILLANHQGFRLAEGRLLDPRIRLRRLDPHRVPGLPRNPHDAPQPSSVRAVRIARSFGVQRGALTPSFVR